MGYYPQFLLHVCPENKNNPGEKVGLTQTRIGSHWVKSPSSCGDRSRGAIPASESISLLGRVGGGRVLREGRSWVGTQNDYSES